MSLGSCRSKKQRSQRTQTKLLSRADRMAANIFLDFFFSPPPSMLQNNQMNPKHLSLVVKRDFLVSVVVFV